MIITTYYHRLKNQKVLCNNPLKCRGSNKFNKINLKITQKAKKLVKVYWNYKEVVQISDQFDDFSFDKIFPNFQFALDFNFLSFSYLEVFGTPGIFATAQTYKKLMLSKIKIPFFLSHQERLEDDDDDWGHGGHVTSFYFSTS